MRKAVPKDMIRYAECFVNEQGPAVITFPHAGYDAGYYLPCLQIMAPAMAPESQSMPYFNRLQRFVPVPIENVVKNFRNLIGLECRMGRIQAGDKPTGSN
jgi:hypothetical protein